MAGERGLMPWVVVGPNGVYWLGHAHNEKGAWTDALGWPDEAEVAEHKRAGWYAAEATVTWKRPAGVQAGDPVQAFQREHLGEPYSCALNGIAATWEHDEGAYARCGDCGRYTLDPKALRVATHRCECGSRTGWSGSFTKPGPDAKWSGRTPGAGEVPHG